jgi:cell division protein ZipA
MEADGLRWWLLIIGSLVIVGLAVHGIWLSRKNSENKENVNKNKKDQEFQPSGWQSDTDSFDEEVNNASPPINDDLDINFGIGTENDVVDLSNDMSAENDYDDLGLGTVRVVPGEQKVDTELEQMLQTDINKALEIPTSKIYASVVTQPKPKYAAKSASSVAETAPTLQQPKATSHNRYESQKVLTQSASVSHQSYRSHDSYEAPEPPPFLLKKEISEPKNTEINSVLADDPFAINPPKVAEQKEVEEKPLTTSDEKLSLSEQARNLVKRKTTGPVKKRLEPKIDQDQIGIVFDDQPVVKPTSKETLKTKPVLSEQPQEVLVLNVKCADENPIPGSALLPMLLTLGFKFGDQDIFHRHINSNGKGPVLFSLANMFKPGNFDIDNLENFTTQGISLFMILPIEGEPHQVFNMMHNAARKIADEFSAQIYDGKRSLLTKQSLQQYVEKIREFERQRLLRG